MGTKIKQTVYEPIPEGVYKAKIDEITEATGGFGPQLKFNFVLDPFEGFPDGKELHAWSSAKFSKKTKLYAWTSAILGVISPDYEFDSDDLIGKSVMLVVGHHEGKDGEMYDNVESIKPVRNIAPATVEQINLALGESEVPA